MTVRNSGQAMIEFVIAILVVVIITAGILQFVELAGRKGELLGEIREVAGRRALSATASIGQRPDYILDWEAGSDELRHTADDEMRRGVAGGTLQGAVVANSVRTPADWSYLDQAHNSAIPELNSSPLPTAALGLIHAERYDTITLLPAMRDWLVGKETITVGAELWFPHLRLEGFD